MPRNITITFEDGTSHQYAGVPDNVTPDQVHQRAAQEFGKGITNIDGGKSAQAAPKQERTWVYVATSAIGNLPSSLGNLASGVAHSVAHPIDTAGNMLDIAAGGLQHALPDALVNAIGADKASQDKASAVGQFYKQRYGSEAGLKDAIANDPAGVMADAATLLTAGGGAAAKIPALQKAGNMAIQAGKAIDPLANAVRGVSAAAPAVGRGVANIIGGVGTHTGGESIQAAARAGLEGGSKAKAFADNMRGNVPMTDVLEQAKAALDNIRKERGNAYREGMAQVSGDQTVLDFKPIMDAMQSQQAMGSYKGKVINSSTAGTQEKLANLVNDWANSDPAQYHTPEGLDALKKAVGDVRDSTDFGTPSRKVADSVYHAVKNQITAQAPVYAETMKGYEEASGLVKEIEKSLSLGNKASADTAMRKLQSLTRNNVNTNYGNRLELAQQLEKNGAPELMAALSGQSLNTITPRGLGGATALGAGGIGYMAGGAGAAIPLLAAQSPRLMGEAAFKTGQLARMLRSGVKPPADVLRANGIDPAVLANYLYQMNQPKEHQ